MHGSAPDIAGQGVANPLAAILTAGMLLEHLGHPDLKDRVQAAVTHCLRHGLVTRELGGALSTAEVTDAVLGHLETN